jgi:hypothetical protein
MSFDFMFFLVEGIGQSGTVQAFKDSAAFLYRLQFADQAHNSPAAHGTSVHRIGLHGRGAA